MSSSGAVSSSASPHRGGGGAKRGGGRVAGGGANEPGRGAASVAGAGFEGGSFEGGRVEGSSVEGGGFDGAGGATERPRRAADAGGSGGAEGALRSGVGAWRSRTPLGVRSFRAPPGTGGGTGSRGIAGALGTGPERPGGGRVERRAAGGGGGGTAAWARRVMPRGAAIGVPVGVVGDPRLRVPSDGASGAPPRSPPPGRRASRNFRARPIVKAARLRYSLRHAATRFFARPVCPPRARM